MKFDIIDLRVMPLKNCGFVKTVAVAAIFYMRAWMKVRVFLLVSIKFGTGDLKRY